MKKIMTKLLALTMACSCVATAVFATPESFRDVPGDSYYAEAVEWAVQSGITAGVGGNKFGSNDPCTRGQIMTMLWRAAGSQTHNAAESAFSDVDTGDYYFDAVLWAVENGITAGIGNNKFGPNNPCTRAQVMTFIWKARGAKEPNGTASQFADVPSDAYYAKAVAWAVENGVTSGVGADKFGSNQTCTRAQIVTFLWKADQITESVPDPTEPPVTEPPHVCDYTTVISSTSGTCVVKGTVTKQCSCGKTHTYDAEYGDHNWVTDFKEIKKPVYKGVYVCKKCGAEFDDVEECGVHCLDCDSTYTAKKYIDHYETETVQKGHKCTICGTHKDD